MLAANEGNTAAPASVICGQPHQFKRREFRPAVRFDEQYMTRCFLQFGVIIV
jgi:hypothetical protein